MFVADAQCMCDRSYEEDDAEDDEAEDTGYDQYQTRDLLKVLLLLLRVPTWSRNSSRSQAAITERSTGIFRAFYVSSFHTTTFHKLHTYLVTVLCFSFVSLESCKIRKPTSCWYSNLDKHVRNFGTKRHFRILKYLRLMIIEIGGNTNIRRDVQCAALTLELPTIKVRKLKTYKIL